MPVKNAEPFLAECLDSILAQTERNWELLAVDDGSSDLSFEILNEYAQGTRIRVFKNTGKGIIDALRLAFSESCGEFITRMDADDRMAPRKLEFLKRDLKSFGKGNLAIGQVKYFSETEVGDGYRRYEQWLNGLTETGTNYADIYKECVIPSPCWMVYRSDLDDCGAFEPNIYPEDYDLCFRFYQQGLKVIPSQEVLHFWRDHPDRSSRTDQNYADNRFLELKLNWFLELDHNPDQELILWGAGAKGKFIAKLLQERSIQFRWVCNNEKKIGKHVYGIEMESVDAVDKHVDGQVIVAVANPEEQNEIRQLLSTDAFWFC